MSNVPRSISLKAKRSIRSASGRINEFSRLPIAKPNREIDLFYALTAISVLMLLPTSIEPANVRSSEAALNGNSVPRTTTSGRLLSLIVFGGLLLLLILVPVPYGTVEPWWEAVFECAVFALATSG